MTTMELEAYKAELAREILTTDSRHVLDEVKHVLSKIKDKASVKTSKEQFKAELKNDLYLALQEVKEIEQGKVTGSTMDELYAELETTE